MKDDPPTNSEAARSMTEAAAVALLTALDHHGVAPWIDGGWGIDALLGRQTREHGDLDIVILNVDEAMARQVLHADGFAEVERWYTTAVHTVWQDNGDREVDLHVITLDGEGNGIFGDDVYPAAGLDGRGAIGGRPVRCITAEVQAEFHRGYELRDRDFHDVGLLNTELGVDLPTEYRR